MNDLSNKDFEAGLVPGIASSPASSHILKKFFVSNQFPKWRRFAPVFQNAINWD